ncbi:MAG: putative selenate reductase subunit YgfK [Anaerolineae bacterium]|nr:putative selenate reductase subunit YgfK [Anaerolineae bacterium]
MSEAMRVQSIDRLVAWMLGELEATGSIFGIHRGLFYVPRPGAPYAGRLFGEALGTPIGPAAGPHTQLAQNIVSAWLCGGRFIELKTVQIMDELDIPRPCIDLADEGYNVEWSQELKLEASAGEYVKAWVLVHLLPRILGYEATAPETIFNMSVGYNLEGIRQPAMQRFMDRLQDASAEIAALLETLQSRFPGLPVAGLSVPARITNSVTLSTMHGCPPDEIEAIARYLLVERGLHTFVKLNPTLLGKEAVLDILHEHLGFREIDIPDRVFAHDLQYGRAVDMIHSLQHVAEERGLTFGVKLSNTLAMANHRGVLPGDEMYMSGRALYPVTMNLFYKLAQEFGGRLPVSYSAGADAWNVATILACGARPVTAASDLLKPGGYARLGQWLAEIEAAMAARGAASLEELATGSLEELSTAADRALQETRYKKVYHPPELPKVETALPAFDCIAAPCVAQCAVCQAVPEYARLIARGDDDGALRVILRDNPLPGITGYVCTHLCQTRCTRINYDQPVLIRELKRFAFEHGKVADAELPGDQAGSPPDTSSPSGMPAPRVAVVGSGPAGLAAGYYLALSGVQVTIFERRAVPGGMPAIAPRFRLPEAVVQADVERITALGVELKLSHPLTQPPEALLEQGYAAVYLGPGFQQDARLEIEGMDGRGVLTALRLLEDVARGETPDLGEKVLVIGGGNTAMDAARTARRLTGQPATVVYRRSQAEMPAEPQELQDLLDEGNLLLELAAPRRVLLEEGRVVGLECVRNELGEAGADGRRRPVPVPGSDFRLPADTVILAVGQQPDLGFLEGSALAMDGRGGILTESGTRRTSVGGIYAGGDVARGPAIIVQACADGRRAAEAICQELGVAFCAPFSQAAPAEEIVEIKHARTRREAPREPGLLPVGQRDGFDLVQQTLSEEAARAEARRCLQCDTVCDKCVEVCPNRANLSYLVDPVHWRLPLFACQEGQAKVVGLEPFALEQGRQILHVDDFCNECGNCTTFCVHQGRPFADKPRLFLDEAAFGREENNAFYLEGTAMRRREGGREWKMTREEGDRYLLETGEIALRFVPMWQGMGWTIEDVRLVHEFEGTLSLARAAEMAVILKAVEGWSFLRGAGRGPAA